MPCKGIHPPDKIHILSHYKHRKITIITSTAIKHTAFEMYVTGVSRNRPTKNVHNFGVEKKGKILQIICK